MDADERSKAMAPVEIIPLAEAVYCEGCRCITRAKNGHCPACAGSGAALMRVEQLMGVEAEDGRKPIWDCHDAVHMWFELTYAQYLTIPRSVLQSMPQEWQRRFARCLYELDEAIDWRPQEGQYWCTLRDAKGRFLEDPLCDYQRGRRRIAPRSEVEQEKRVHAPESGA